MQGWVNRTNKNYGFIFRLATESVYRRMSFASSDYSVDADKPKLNIEFSSTSPDTLIPQYDNYIVNLNTTYNSEHEDFLGVSNLPNQGNTIIKSLLKFNLSGLPSDILITNAKLKLYRKTSGSMSGKVKLVNSSWNNLVTWATQPTTVDPLIDFSIGSGSAYVEIPLLNLIKYWYDNPSLNYGVMLEANTDNTLDYYSYDYTGDVHKWPELIIEFVSLSATLNPVSDWTILDSDQNCHQTGNLKVGLDNSNGLNRSYIKFDFSSIPTNRVITNAFLYLKATSASNAPVNIVAYPIQDNFSGCTGTAGTTMAGQQRATPNAYINVTSQVTGWNQQSNLYHGLSLDINESVTNRISYFYDYESGTNVPTLLLEHIPTPITQQPASTGDCDAATPSSSYQVVVSSDAQSYQWERNRPSVGTWEVITTPSSEFTINSSPATQSTLSVTQLQTDGTQFRCKVQMPGYFVYTAVASYTIFSRPVTTITADCNTACDDDPVTISASATMNPTFLWSTGETTASIVKNPAISTGYYFTATETVSGHNCSSQSSTQTIDVCSHIYAELNRKTDGGYAITQKGFLQFVYKEEYNSTGITINIYNKDGILLTYTRTVHFGENLLYLKLIGQGLTEGSLYNAEVINGKGEKYYLSFKYSAN